MNESSSGYVNESSSGYVNESSSGYVNESSSGYVNESSSGYVNESSSSYVNESSSGCVNESSFGCVNESSSGCVNESSSSYVNEFSGYVNNVSESSLESSRDVGQSDSYPQSSVAGNIFDVNTQQPSFKISLTSFFQSFIKFIPWCSPSIIQKPVVTHRVKSFTKRSII
ncbi:uncharacterized protein [Clytia hemisphaerica]|uniref:uncharacterized protein n=1 Tax=Clytia hemisphaerica TaxID=252671 RepID=UPI0034D4ECAC